MKPTEFWDYAVIFEIDILLTIIAILKEQLMSKMSNPKTPRRNEPELKSGQFVFI